MTVSFLSYPFEKYCILTKTCIHHLARFQRLLFLLRLQEVPLSRWGKVVSMLHGMPLGPWRKILFDQLDWILRPEQSLWCSIRLALRLWRSAQLMVGKGGQGRNKQKHTDIFCHSWGVPIDRGKGGRTGINKNVTERHFFHSRGVPTDLLDVDI